MPDKKKPRLDKRKGAKRPGSRKKPTPSSTPGSGKSGAATDSDGSSDAELRQVIAKAAKTSTDATPRSTPRSTPGAATPVVSLDHVERLHRKLRNAQKKLRQIEALSILQQDQLNPQQRTKLASWHATKTAVDALAAELEALGSVAELPSRTVARAAESLTELQARSEADASSRPSSSLSMHDLSSHVANLMNPDIEVDSIPVPVPPPQPTVRRSDIAASSSLEEARLQQAVEQAAAAAVLQQQHRRAEAQRRRRAREKASKAAGDAFAAALERRCLDVDVLLAVEHVLQPRTYGQPNGRLRLDFLQLRGDSRARGPMRGEKQDKSKLPAVTHLDGLSDLQTVLLRDPRLFSLAHDAIEDEKERYRKDHMYHGLLGDAFASHVPSQTFMELRTQTHQALMEACTRKAGRPRKEAGEKQQLFVLSTMRKGQYSADAIWASHVMRHHTAKRALSYAVVPELTLAGTRRLVGWLDDLPSEAIPRLQKPSTDTRHDQQLHVIFRRHVFEEVGLNGPTLISQD